MRQFVVRFVPEQTKNDSFLDQFLAISEDLNFKFSRGSMPTEPSKLAHACALFNGSGPLFFCSVNGVLINSGS